MLSSMSGIAWSQLTARIKREIESSCLLSVPGLVENEVFHRPKVALNARKVNFRQLRMKGVLKRNEGLTELLGIGKEKL